MSKQNEKSPAEKLLKRDAVAHFQSEGRLLQELGERGLAHLCRGSR
jgi:hypothetical protein